MSDYGHARLFRGFGFWWRYDLTTGARWAHANLGRTLRFYGITIGQCCIGISIACKEESRRG